MVEKHGALWKETCVEFWSYYGLYNGCDNTDHLELYGVNEYCIYITCLAGCLVHCKGSVPVVNHIIIPY